MDAIRLVCCVVELVNEGTHFVLPRRGRGGLSVDGGVAWSGRASVPK